MLVGMGTSVMTVEIRMEILQRLNKEISFELHTLEHIPERIKDYILQESMCINVHISVIHNSEVVETA